jgi:hypothetical protein
MENKINKNYDITNKKFNNISSYHIMLIGK